MENLASTVALVNHVISKGARKIGFVGDPAHCNSFRERWEGLCYALSAAGIPKRDDLCILEPDDSPYSDPKWLSEKILQMPQYPDALICANDFIAIHVMSALKQLGVAVPDQIMITGFDGTAQSAVIEPSLTTVQIPSEEIGRIAADLLLNRLTNLKRPPINIYVKTEPVYRESTNRE